MKIAIIGPGAMGLLFSAFLTKSKEEIWLLAKDKDRAAEISEKGIKITGVLGDWDAKVKCTDDPKEIGVVDLAIIAVKSYATKEISVKIKPLVGDDTLVLTIQNGLGNIEVLVEAFGEDKVIGGLTNQGATLMAITHVKHAGKGETIIGTTNGSASVGLRQIREIFNKVGIDCRVTKDIKGMIWSKLIVNVGINALTAISHLKNGQLLKFESINRIMCDAVKEATKVAKRKRIKLAYDDPLSKVESVCEATADNISSMLQDVVNKKRTEIDAINGAIVRHAQTLGIQVPVNSMLVDLIKTIESSYRYQI